MDNLVDHVVNNEVYRDYFTDDASRNAFLKISDTSLLRNHMMKAQNGASSGATSLKFVPTRGPMLELSGHVGDACWASKYESIAKEFPNITAISFVRNPGKNSERLVGAGLMIETVDQNTGEEVIVLRGTNPIENYVNGVKVEDFFGALTDYAKKVAGGRRIATVIDDEPGRATTNRPVLCTYLKDVAKGNLTGVEPLKLPDNSTFNGYVLSAKKPYNHPVYYIN
jgi:hypothetical protein